MNALAADANYHNVHVMSLGTPFKDAGVAPVDIVWTSLNYHDLHNRPNADLMVFNKQMMDALKPGGLYIVIDHAAQQVLARATPARCIASTRRW